MHGSGGGRVAASARIGVGGAFQPIPGTQPVSVPGGDGVARIPARRGRCPSTRSPPAWWSTSTGGAA